MKWKFLCLIPIVGLIKVYNYSFYTGAISGIFLTVLIQYIMFIQYLKRKHVNSQITIDFCNFQNYYNRNT